MPRRQSCIQGLEKKLYLRKLVYTFHGLICNHYVQNIFVTVIVGKMHFGFFNPFLLFCCESMCLHF